MSKLMGDKTQPVIPLVPSRYLETGEVKVPIKSNDETVIHKYPVRIHSFSLFMVKGSTILDIAEQHGEVFMWAQRPADTQIDCIGRNFEVFATGEVMPPKNRIYLKTLHHSSGLVYHFFELI